jgi:hypothetical protein
MRRSVAAPPPRTRSPLRAAAPRRHAATPLAPLHTIAPSRRHATAILLALLCAVAVSACGDTLQDQPIAPQALESVIVKSRFPVYWLGFEFQRMRITGVTIDPGGAVTIHYGDCLVGGQYTCVTPVTVVSSPDNSFVPGASAGHAVRVRSVAATSAQGGRTVSMATGSVVVSVHARDASLASGAVETMAPLNKVGLPLRPLPPAVPDTGFDRVPLPSELPPGASIPRTPGT